VNGMQPRWQPRCEVAENGNRRRERYLCEEVKRHPMPDPNQTNVHAAKL